MNTLISHIIPSYFDLILHTASNVIVIELQTTSGGSLGRFIPLEVTMDIMMSQSDAVIARLRKQLKDRDELFDYMSQYLDPDQRMELQVMVSIFLC